jgi:hypothetical protein
VALRIGAVLALIGGVLVVLGVQEWFAFRTASATPEEISLSALIARGTEGNAHVILKDFELCDNLVYETEGSATSWNKVWVPVIPAQGGGGGRPPLPGMMQPQPQPQPQPHQIQALIFSIRIRNPQELEQRCNVPRLQALVTNKLVSLGSEERKHLEQSYPGTDFSRCLIIQEGREPPGPVKMLLICGGGSVLLLAGLGLLGAVAYSHFSDSGSRPAKRKRRRPKPGAEELDEVQPADDEDEQPRPRRPRPRRDED